MSSIPVGTGTGVGSMPGTDPLRAAEISVGECEFAFLPELPARGLGADMVGRAAALLDRLQQMSLRVEVPAVAHG